jgi:hypothetical protein
MYRFASLPLLLILAFRSAVAAPPMLIVDGSGHVEMVNEDFNARYNALEVNKLTMRGEWKFSIEDASLNFDLVVAGPWASVASFRDTPTMSMVVSVALMACG